MKITKVGQLKKALSKFSDDDSLMLNLKDDFNTYNIGLELNSYDGPGIKEDEVAFFNNGSARMDFKLKAYEGFERKEMRAKVAKFNK